MTIGLHHPSGSHHWACTIHWVYNSGFTQSIGFTPSTINHWVHTVHHIGFTPFTIDHWLTLSIGFTPLGLRHSPYWGYLIHHWSLGCTTHRVYTIRFTLLNSHHPFGFHHWVYTIHCVDHSGFTQSIGFTPSAIDHYVYTIHHIGYSSTSQKLPDGSGSLYIKTTRLSRKS